MAHPYILETPIGGRDYFALENLEKQEVGTNGEAASVTKSTGSQWALGVFGDGIHRKDNPTAADDTGILLDPAQYDEQMPRKYSFLEVMIVFLKTYSTMEKYYRCSRELSLNKEKAAYKKIRDKCYQMAATSIGVGIAVAGVGITGAAIQLRGVTRDLKDLRTFVGDLDFDKLKTDPRYLQKVKKYIKTKSNDLQEAFKKWQDSQPGSATAAYSRNDGVSDMPDNAPPPPPPPPPPEKPSEFMAEAGLRKAFGESQQSNNLEFQGRASSYQLYSVIFNNVTGMGNSMQQSFRQFGEGDNAMNNAEAKEHSYRREEAENDRVNWRETTRQIGQSFSAIITGKAQAIYDASGRY